MKRLILILLLLSRGSLFAVEVVSFGEKDFYVLPPSGTGSPANPAQKAFYDDFRSDFDHQDAFERSMPLVSPPEWGKTVHADTRGEIQFHPSFPAGFVCRLMLEHLLPDHRYILTLNGNPQKPGNRLLPTPVTGNEQERYYDFLFVRTDSQGNFDSRLGIYLKPGAYGVRCYVKDTDDFKIVLYRDFFDFEVR